MSTILVIDDDTDVLKTLIMGLQSVGHDVSSAGNGAEALVELSSQKFDIVVTDILMPELDGIELIKRIKAEAPAIKILAISGGGSVLPVDYTLSAAATFGADSILYKPFSSDELADAITGLLEGGDLLC